MRKHPQLNYRVEAESRSPLRFIAIKNKIFHMADKNNQPNCRCALELNRNSKRNRIIPAHRIVSRNRARLRGISRYSTRVTTPTLIVE